MFEHFIRGIYLFEKCLSRWFPGKYYKKEWYPQLSFTVLPKITDQLLRKINLWEGGWEVNSMLLVLYSRNIFTVKVNHSKYCRSVQGQGGISDGRSLRLPPRGESKGTEAEHPASRGSPGGDPRGGLCPRLTFFATGNEYGGMTDGAVVNGKLDGPGCVGMARYPLPKICPRIPIPPQILLQLQCQFLHIPCPRIQEGQPFHGASQ